MQESALANSAPSAGGLVAQRQGRALKSRSGRGFWQMLGLVYPHRRMMATGVALGIGVALTYAASLVGLLPVLSVVVEQKNLNAYLHERADHAAELHRWHAPLLSWAADFFPGPATANAPMTTLLILLGVLITLNLLGNGFRVLSQFLVLQASHRAMMDLRRRMYRKALRVPMSAVSGETSGIVTQFMSDARELFLGITTLFGKVAREPLKAVCVLAVAIWLDWRITAVALAITPPAVGLLWFFGRKVRKAMVKLLQGYGLMLGGLEETLQGIAVVKGYAQEGAERQRMWQLERRMFKQQTKLSWIEAVSSPVIEVVGLLMACGGIVWLAGRTFADPQAFPPSNFVTMVILLAAMLDPIRKVANVYNVVQRSGAAAERIFAFLAAPEEHSPARARRLDARSARAVSFENVSFRYRPEAPLALDNVTLRVQAGECIAIVGPNGSGKSTLLRLLPRLLDPQDGAVSIDGVDVRELSLKALREQIAIVDQRPAIFARTVRENIAYGHARASLDEIRAAAAQAYAAEFIDQLPKGYDTILGEFGASLSGGQRQRISIARAFLKRASILIFDEATSEIDAESERKIHAALDALRRGRTTFLIAHRHTVMDMADRIAVFDAGRLIDAGSRDELLSRCPLFLALYRSPAG